jgi:hypothetical protein
LAEFRSYVGSANKVSAIEFDNVIPYREPLSLAQISHLIEEDLRPPQSFCDLNLHDEHSAWAKAVSVATLLHGRFPMLNKLAKSKATGGSSDQAHAHTITGLPR